MTVINPRNALQAGHEAQPFHQVQRGVILDLVGLQNGTVFRIHLNSVEKGPWPIFRHILGIMS